MGNLSAVGNCSKGCRRCPGGGFGHGFNIVGEMLSDQATGCFIDMISLRISSLLVGRGDKSQQYTSRKYKSKLNSENVLWSNTSDVILKDIADLLRIRDYITKMSDLIKRLIEQKPRRRQFIECPVLFTSLP